MYRMPEKQTYSRTVLNCSRICFHLYANPCKLPLLSIKLKNPGFLYDFSICFVSFYIIFVKAWFFHVNLRFWKKKFKEIIHLQPRQYRYACLFHFFTLGSLSIDDEIDDDNKLHRERTGSRTSFTDGKFQSQALVRLLWTTSPQKTKEIRMRCSKCLVTVCPKRSIALSLCLSAAAFSPFSFPVPRRLFLPANYSLSVISLRAWSSLVSS